IVEPRVLLRALCPTQPGELEVLGEDAPFWDELRHAFADEAGPSAATSEPPAGGGIVEDRRREGFAGVAGDLFSSGEPVLVAVADVPRRRAGLEAVVAGLSDGPMPVVSWTALAARPELAAPFEHLVALDPPPGGIRDPLLHATPRAQLAWGPAEADFALVAYRASLDLRPQLTEVYRALRELPSDAPAPALEAALRGPARYPRSAAVCASLLKVLTELGLVEFDRDVPACRIVEAVRSDLELSPSFRAARDRLEAVEQALAPELPSALPAAATG
ncbi:MAG TPA: hypothetical protein VFC77_02595, partial [Myxococcota bacterium]|nr:hypothetical protein [Myxococcota bacterium]